MSRLKFTIEKQKTLRRDCFNNIEKKTNLEVGVSGKAFTYISYNILTHIDVIA